jgi:GNAT superfamily N-acetyltransferase
MLLRRAEPGDEPVVAEVHVRSWQVAYRGLLPDAYLDALDPAAWAKRYTFDQTGPERPVTTVAIVDGAIRGFATAGTCRDDEARPAGELYAIYVHPDWWGSGMGRALIGDARRRLESLGYQRAVLWVLAGNERAQRFYRRDGWNGDGSGRRDEVHGITVDELRYRRALP